MNEFLLNVLNEYAKEYQNEYTTMKPGILFTKPKIYNAGGDLSKRWYVYFSYRNPITGKMERQSPVYLSINKHNTFEERTKVAKDIRNIVEKMLKEGHVPTQYQQQFYDESKNIDIQEAIQLSLKNAEATMKESTYRDYRQRLLKFEKWLYERHFQGKDIAEITRKTIMNYLNEVLQNTSPKNRNNTRGNLSMFFAYLKEEEYISKNIVETIKVLKAEPKRNKTYTKEQEGLLFRTLEQKDKEMLLFIKFISYNFLRPVEVCRLKVKDIDFASAQLYLETKTKLYKTKIIPQILLDEIQFLKKENPEHFIFTPTGVGEWERTEMGRREYWGKRFKKIKEPLRLGEDYTMYSFRHTFITKLYRELRTEYPPYETKSRLMLITGHTSMTALENYLRDIDAELPEDYSDLLK